MSKIRVARRYAQSLIDLAEEKRELEAVKGDMDMFAKVVAENRDLKLLLSSPVVKSRKKLTILKEIFFGKVSQMTFTLFKVVCEKGREGFLYDMALEFRRLYNQRKGIQEATVLTATPLTDELRQRFAAMVHERTGRLADLRERVDRSLIGGYVLKIGDQQIDDSVKGRLQELKLTFSDNTYTSQL